MLKIMSICINLPSPFHLQTWEKDSATLKDRQNKYRAADPPVYLR